MLDIIKQWVKDFGVIAILYSKQVQGAVNAYKVDFLDKDDKYHSCVIFYDDVRIYGSDAGFIGEYDNNVMPLLDKYHRVFNSKEEWLAGRFSTIETKDINRFVSRMHPTIIDREYADFTLLDIRYGYNPVIIVVEFTYKGARQKNLILVPGQVADCSKMYPGNTEDFSRFLHLIGVESYVSIKNNMEIF